MTKRMLIVEDESKVPGNQPFHFIDDDKELAQIFEDCKKGQQLCGQCKKLAQEKVREFFKDLKEKKEAARDKVKEFLVDD